MFNTCSMCKKSLLLLFILLTLTGGLGVASGDEEIVFVGSETVNDTKETVLIIFDYRNHFADLRDAVTTIRETLGHFRVSVETVDQHSYQPQQMVGYDYVFVLGMQGQFDNEDFLKDIAQRRDTICWVGEGIETYLELSGNTDLEYTGPIFDLTDVSYKGETYPVGVKREFSGIEIHSGNVEVYSELSTGAKAYPFILNDGSFWYVSRIDLNEPMYFIFADMLIDILPRQIVASPKVYLRIEDVHPFRDPEKLKAIADYLGDKKIPFMVGLIPAHRLPDEKYITEFDDMPEFLEAVKYMQDRGGTIILHGYTHTVFGSDITGEGFEYWDGNKDTPLESDIDAWVRYTIGRGVKLTIENDIYPLGFEAPHYAMSQEAYKSLKKYFSTYSGQIQSSDWGFSTSVIPYEVHDSELFNKFLPESLGYIDPTNPDYLETIKHNYKMIKIVREHMAGVFFHPYLDIEYLEELVEYLESENVEFYDMRDDFHWVKFDDYELINNHGQLTVNYPDSRLDSRKLFRKIFSRTSFILIGILGVIVLIFFKLVYSSHQHTKRKMKR